MNEAVPTQFKTKILCVGIDFWVYFLLISIHIGLLVHGIFVHFPNTDEIAHLPAAVSRWHFGTFDYYRVNPPLVDWFAGLGALNLRHEYKWDVPLEMIGGRMEFAVGATRFKELGLALHDDFILPRLLLIPFSLLGCGLLSWLALKELGRLTLALCVGSVAASLSVAPHFLTFFNRLAGGPEKGWHVLGFSNVDWGQDLLFVKKWVEAHPEKRPCWVDPHYYGSDGTYFGLGAEPPPMRRLRTPGDPPTGIPRDLPKPGWYIVNVLQLYDRPDSAGLGYFRYLKPEDRIAFSFLVYRIGEEERRKIAEFTE